MQRWRDSLVSPSSTILDAIQIIDHSALKIALVVDQDNHLLGTVTDGDIRRGILKGINLDCSVQQIMNTSPHVVGFEGSHEKARAIMRNTTLHQIPVLDKYNRVVGLEIIDELINDGHHTEMVVLMAGGAGNRLRPLTENCPKPLLDVGGKPVLETILDSFIEQGFSNFFISVNYKADMIKNHFEDGTRWGVRIKYIYEEKELGTAGAISLLPEKPDKAFILMNGDILTKIDFHRLLQFHTRKEADTTVCVRNCSFQIPYGVVETSNDALDNINEKPLLQFLINAGVYVLNPEILEFIPHNMPMSMTGLLNTLINQNKQVAVFPIREYWIDIGHINDYIRAKGEFAEVFG